MRKIFNFIGRAIKRIIIGCFVLFFGFMLLLYITEPKNNSSAEREKILADDRAKGVPSHPLLVVRHLLDKAETAPPVLGIHAMAVATEEMRNLPTGVPKTELKDIFGYVKQDSFVMLKSDVQSTKNYEQCMSFIQDLKNETGVTLVEMKEHVDGQSKIFQEIAEKCPSINLNSGRDLHTPTSDMKATSNLKEGVVRSSVAATWYLFEGTDLFEGDRKNDSWEKMYSAVNIDQCPHYSERGINAQMEIAKEKSDNIHGFIQYKNDPYLIHAYNEVFVNVKGGSFLEKNIRLYKFNNDERSHFEEMCNFRIALNKERAISYVLNPNSGVFYFSLDPELKNDSDVAKAALKSYASNIQYVPEWMREDKDIVMETVQRDGSIIQHVSEKLKSDRDFILNIVKVSPGSYEYISDELKGDREILKTALEAQARINKGGNLFRKSPEKFRDDVELVTMAVKDHWPTLGLASERLRDNEEIVAIAVEQNKAALKYASPRLQKLYEEKSIVGQ